MDTDRWYPAEGVLTTLGRHVRDARAAGDRYHLRHLVRPDGVWLQLWTGEAPEPTSTPWGPPVGPARTFDEECEP